MKVHLTPGAQEKIELIRALKTPGTGFLFGTRLGQYLLLEDLLPLAFDEHGLEPVYAQVFERQGEKLLGVYFMNRPIFLDDWFIGDIILEIADPGLSFYLCSPDKRPLPL